MAEEGPEIITIIVAKNESAQMWVNRNLLPVQSSLDTIDVQKDFCRKNEPEPSSKALAIRLSGMPSGPVSDD